MSATPVQAQAQAQQPTKSLWVEHRNPQGRVYWYHTVEKRSVWNKPPELKTARERAIDQTEWREYQSGDRKYYVHAKTKETTWTLPKEAKDLLDAIPDEPPAQVATPVSASSATPRAGAVASPTQQQQQQQRQLPNGVGVASPAVGASPHLPSPGAPAAAPRHVYPGPPPGFGTPSAPPPAAAAPQARVGATPLAASPPTAAAASSTPGAVPGAPPPLQAPASAQLPRPVPSGPAAAVATPPPPILSGESAFLHLLRTKGVTTSWTWEQTMRAVITDPMYKSLKSLAERKAAFHKFLGMLRDEEEAARRERVRAAEPAFRSLVGAAREKGEIKEYASFEAARKRLGENAAWKEMEAVGELEARGVWETVKREWRDAEQARKRELRHRNMDMLMSLLRTFEADVTTRWKDAHRTVVESPEWTSDAHLSQMDVTDMMAVFEELIRSLEREREAEVREAERKRRREERERRDAFKRRLDELRDEGVLRAGVAWPRVYERVRDDEAFRALLGQPGSSPLDLFFDALDDIEARLEARADKVERVLRRGGAAAATDDGDGPSSTTAGAAAAARNGSHAGNGEAPLGLVEGTTYAEFLDRLKAAAARARVDGADEAIKDDEELRTIFEQLLEREVRQARELRRRVERKLRHIGEDLRYAFRKAPSVPLDDDEALSRPWETHWRERLARLALRDWVDLGRVAGASEEQVEEARRGAWEKFVRRQKEKNAERRGRENGDRQNGARERGHSRAPSDAPPAAAAAEAAGGDAASLAPSSSSRRKRGAPQGEDGAADARGGTSSRPPPPAPPSRQQEQAQQQPDRRALRSSRRRAEGAAERAPGGGGAREPERKRSRRGEAEEGDSEAEEGEL